MINSVVTDKFIFDMLSEISKTLTDPKSISIMMP